MLDDILATSPLFITPVFKCDIFDAHIIVSTRNYQSLD